MSLTLVTQLLNYAVAALCMLSADRRIESCQRQIEENLAQAGLPQPSDEMGAIASVLSLLFALTPVLATYVVYYKQEHTHDGKANERASHGKTQSSQNPLQKNGEASDEDGDVDHAVSTN